jgi:fumarate hydratase class II
MVTNLLSQQAAPPSVKEVKDFLSDALELTSEAFAQDITACTEISNSALATQLSLNLALLLALKELNSVLPKLERMLRRKALELYPQSQNYDAANNSLHRMFSFYGTSMQENFFRLEKRQAQLLKLSSQLGTYSEFPIVKDIIAKQSGFSFVVCDVQESQTMTTLLALSAILREMGANFIELAGELRLFLYGTKQASLSSSLLQSGLSAAPNTQESLNYLTYAGDQSFNNDISSTYLANSDKFDQSTIKLLVTNNLLNTIVLVKTAIEAVTNSVMPAIQLTNQSMISTNLKFSPQI